jgi:hypothetical protein
LDGLDLACADAAAGLVTALTTAAAASAIVAACDKELGLRMVIAFRPSSAG